MPRSESVRGLIFTPSLTGGQVSSLEMTFEPSIGIMARKIDKLGLDIRSFKEPLTRAIREVVIPSIAMNFAKHGRPRWEELSEETIAKKGHARPLLLTGALQKTMKQLNIWHIDREKALLANLPSRVWYGAVHQAGYSGSLHSTTVRNVGAQNISHAFSASGGAKHSLDIAEAEGAIPARPFVMLQPEDERKIDEIFLDWLDERILMSGLGAPDARSQMMGPL